MDRHSFAGTCRIAPDQVQLHRFNDQGFISSGEYDYGFCTARQHGNHCVVGLWNSEICGLQAGLRPRQVTSRRVPS